MTDDMYNDICRRIVEKCRKRGWYGTDTGDPRPLAVDGEYVLETHPFDSSEEEYSSVHRVCVEDIPAVHGFEYPPLSEEQVQSFEQSLGFPLPPFLRAIYTRVANGGFGPDLFQMESMVSWYLYDGSGSRLVDFRIFEERNADEPIIMFPNYIEPRGFFTLCDCGCSIYKHLEIGTGRVFRSACYSEHTWGFQYEAPSLEAWFERWLERK